LLLDTCQISREDLVNLVFDEVNTKFMRFLCVQNILDAGSSTRNLLSLPSSRTGHLSKHYMSRFFVLSSVN